MRSLLCLSALLALAAARHHHHHKAADEETKPAEEEHRSVPAAELIKKDAGKDAGKTAQDWNKDQEWGGGSQPVWGAGSSSHHGRSSHPSSSWGAWSSPSGSYYGHGGRGSGRHHGRRSRHGNYYPYGYYYGGGRGGHHGGQGGPGYYPAHYYGGHRYDPVHRGRGSKHSQCSPGYYWDNKAWGCVDIDECDHQQQSICPHGRVCVNIPGSYRCVSKHHGGYYGPPVDKSKEDDDCEKPTCSTLGYTVDEDCEVSADDFSWLVTMSEKTKLSTDDCCLLCKAQHGCVFAEYKEAEKHDEGYCRMYKKKDNPESGDGSFTCMYRSH